MQSAGETFQRFRWFTLVLIVLFPIYPSLSLIGSDENAHGADYDDSTIITAYSDDSLGNPDAHISETGLVNLVARTTISESPDTPILTQKEDTSLAQAPKKTNAIQKYTIQTGDTLAKLSSRFDVSIDAIRWANDLDTDTLKP
jgi:LysM repeat protein